MKLQMRKFSPPQVYKYFYNIPVIFHIYSWKINIFKNMFIIPAE